MVKHKRKEVESLNKTFQKQSKFYKEMNLNMLKEHALVIFAILGFVSLIGIFWGNEVLIKVGIILFVVMLIIIFAIIINNLNEYY